MLGTYHLKKVVLNVNILVTIVAKYWCIISATEEKDDLGNLQMDVF
jgi:hypothetical protein